MTTCKQVCLDELCWDWVTAFLELCAANTDETRRDVLARLAEIEAQEREYAA